MSSGQRTAPQTPVRGPVTPSPTGKNAAKSTPRAPGHLAGVGGTPAPGTLLSTTPEPSLIADHIGNLGTPVPIPEGINPEQAAALQLQMQAIQPVLPTPEKRWYDRVVDSILGDDPCKWTVMAGCFDTDLPAQAAHSKYALVCGECFRHNGLVGSKYEWERMRASAVTPQLSRS